MKKFWCLALLSLAIYVPSYAQWQVGQRLFTPQSSTTPIALISHATCNNTSTGGNCTTPAINNTGSTLGVFMVLDFDSLSSAPASYNGVPSDSSSNVWYGPFYACAAAAGACYSQENVRIYFAPNFIASASQTFTYTGSTFASVAIQTFSNVILSSPQGQAIINGVTTGTSVSTGSLTPASNNQVLVVGMANAVASGTPTINGGFTASNAGPNVSNATGFLAGYLVQTTATAANPTVSWTTSGATAIAMTTFQNSAAGSSYDLFCDNESSTSGTTVTTAILSADCHGVGIFTRASNFTASGSPGTLTVQSYCQGPQLPTSVNVGGNSYNAASDTKGYAFTTGTPTTGVGYNYSPPSPVPTTAPYSRYISIDYPSADSGQYVIGGGLNPNGDSASLGYYLNNIYLETDLNRNGASDSCVGINSQCSTNGYTWGGMYGTSTTSNTIGTGANLTFTMNQTMPYAVGAAIRIEELNTPANSMLAAVVSITGTTMVVSPKTAHGSGTFTNWVVVPWHKAAIQFNGYLVATTGTSTCTVVAGTCTITTSASLGLTAGTVVSFFSGTSNGISGTVTSDIGLALVINAVNAYGTGSLLTGNVSTSAHKLIISDSLANVIVTIQKAANPAAPGAIQNYGFGFGGDNTTAGIVACVDNELMQWVGVGEWPL